MAKSMRSKRMRKMRAIKREKAAPKELLRLKKTLSNDPIGKMDEEMKDMVTVKEAKDLVQEHKDKGDKMELEGASTFHKKTFKNEFGNYPVWMNKREMKRIKKKQPKKTPKGRKSKRASTW